MESHTEFAYFLIRSHYVNVGQTYLLVSKIGL